MALVAGAFVVVAQPAQGVVVYGGVTVVDSTGEVVAGAEVNLYGLPGPDTVNMYTNQDGLVNIAASSYASSVFDEITEAKIRISTYNGALEEFQSFDWTGAGLEQNSSGTAQTLSFQSGSSTVLALELPVNLPTGAITGTFTQVPAIPPGEAENYFPSINLFSEDGVYLFEYRSGGGVDGEYRLSGLPNGTYYAQFSMFGSSASFPSSYATTYYGSSLTLAAATPIIVSSGDVTAGVNAQVVEAAILSGVVRRSTASGSEPVLVGDGESAKPAVSLYPVGSSPEAPDALQVYTFSDLEFGDGSYRIGRIPAGTYQLAFGVLSSGSGNAGFTAYQYYNGENQAEDADSLVLPGGENTVVNVLYPGFGDVPETYPFIDEITWLASSGITAGYSDGTFRPLASVNRDAMAAFLYRFAGEPAFIPPATSPFSDVPPSRPFYKEITWLASTGVTTGYSDGTFRPLNAVNRDAMAAFLYRFAGEPAFTPPATSPFTDVTPSTPFYKEITWLASTGVTSGYSNGTFRALNAVNRDAMAAFLFRYSGLFI